MTTLLLETTDKKQVTVDNLIIRDSKVLTHAFEVSSKEDANDEAMPVNVSSAALDRIKTFTDFYKDAPVYVVPKDFLEHQREEKDSKVMKWLAGLDHDDFMELHEAVNFFNMPRLTDAMVICLLFHTQTGDIKEIRKTFGMRTNVTAEEEKAHKARFEKQV
uniref:Skp1 domain-containing protein n=1 Tax=Panagrellus redivivus TaxID=6233 RepID=A0A7E4ZW87_PANRE